MNQTTILQPIRGTAQKKIELLSEIDYNIRMVEGRISENQRKIDRMLKAGNEAWYIYPYTSLTEQQAERAHNIDLLIRLRYRFNKVLESLKY